MVLQITDCEIEILQQCKCYRWKSKARALIHVSGEGIVNQLAEDIRQHMSTLYKCCESIALLDMVRDLQLRRPSLTEDSWQHSQLMPFKMTMVLCWLLVTV